MHQKLANELKSIMKYLLFVCFSCFHCWVELVQMGFFQIFCFNVETVFSKHIYAIKILMIKKMNK